MVMIRLICFIIVHLFIMMEARELQIQKQPKYHGIVEAKVDPQSYKHGGKVNFHNIAKLESFIKEEELIDIKANERKLTNKGDVEDKLKAKVLTNGGGRKISENSGKVRDESRIANSHGTLENKTKEESKNRGISEDSFTNLQSHDVKAANEVWTLINKDYPGNGKARHNPQINNR